MWTSSYTKARSAQQLIDAWIPLSVAINSIQRSMGQPDTYPFILSPSVVANFINELLASEAATTRAA